MIELLKSSQSDRRAVPYRSVTERYKQYEIEHRNFAVISNKPRRLRKRRLLLVPVR